MHHFLGGVMKKTSSTAPGNVPTASTNKTADVLRAKLENYKRKFGFCLEDGDLLLLNHGWYVTHAGLIKLSHKQKCAGIDVSAVPELCDSVTTRWIFRATVYRTKSCKGFTGYGDADPSNVSAAMRGAELRIAETRAVNRALRKAYGIGLCSVEELGSSPTPPSNGSAKRAGARLGANLEVITPTPLRDQLRQLIRQHRLDPVLTKSYVLEHLGVKVLRDASREQVAELVEHLQKRLFEDRDGFLEELAKLSAPAEQKEVA
jgi:hypothetical protein